MTAVIPDGRPSSCPRHDERDFRALGLRERLELVGGALEAGPLPTGGYRVLATVPLAEVGLA